MNGKQPEGDPTVLSTSDRLQRIRGLLSSRGARAEHSASVAISSVRARNRPLTEIQEALWTLCEGGDGGTYNVPWAVRIEGSLDVRRLENAWLELQQRHDPLRSRILIDRGVPYAAVGSDSRSAIVQSVLSEEQAFELVDAASNSPFDVSGGHLCDLYIVRVTDTVHYLLLLGHHLVMDGWSQAILTHQLTQLYAGHPMPEASASDFWDYAEWSRRPSVHDRVEESIGYWTAKLADLPHLEFPSDRPRPAQSSGAGALQHGYLDKEAYASLTQLCISESLPRFAGVAAIFATVLRRYCQQEDLVFGSVMAGRSLHGGVDETVGMFANSVVARLQTSPNETFRDLLRRSGEEVANLLQHENFPFSRVVQATRSAHIPGMNPLFQVSLTMQTSATQGGGSIDGTVISPVYLTSSTSRFDLAFQVHDPIATEAPRVWVEYATELFDSTRIEALIKHFDLALAFFTQQPDACLAELDLVTDEERSRLRELSTGPVVRHPQAEMRVERLVIAAASEAGNYQRVALQYSGRAITYQELLERATAAANELHGAVMPGQVIGLHLEDRIDIIVAQLACWMSGLTWTVLDRSNPPARVRNMLEQIACTSIITDGPPLDAAPSHLSVRRIPRDILDRRAQELAFEASYPVDAPAYVIFTSGSTGGPKGVQVSHRALTGFLLNAKELFHVGPDDRFLMLASPSFDVSLFDVFTPLISGAAAIGDERESITDPDGLAEFLRTNEITVGDVPPALLKHIDPETLPCLRQVFVGLEPFPASLPYRWVSAGRVFNNGYGPTEATVACINYSCTLADGHGMPPIGRPLPNQKAYILGDRDRLQPHGLPGEILICGSGLADGYVGDEERTSASFVPTTVGGFGERGYLTGDYAYWDRNDQLVFAGRRDSQVKVRGYRIELGDVENGLLQHHSIESVVARIMLDQHGEPTLVAYYVASSSISDEDLRAHALAYLPPHMSPSVYIALTTVPLTPNGKIDIRGLPDAFDREKPAAEPMSESEREVALVCATVLDIPVERIDATTNLFAVGANSLNMARLLRRLNDGRAQRLRMYDLMRSPSPRGIAEALATPTSGTADVSDTVIPPWITALTPDSQADRKVFMVHASGGTSSPYQLLAEELSPAFDVLGIEAVGLHGQQAHQHLKDMVIAYSRAMKRIQPHGPYRLGAWSIGASITVGLASQLRAEGEVVESLFFLDAMPAALLGDRTDETLLGDFVHDTIAILGAGEPHGSSSVAREVASPAAAVQSLIDKSVLSEADRTQMESRASTFVATVRAGMETYGQYLDSPALLVSANPHTDEDAWALTLGRGRTIRVEADHYSLLRKPVVSNLAIEIVRHLEESAS